MNRTCPDITQAIGNTPLVRLANLAPSLTLLAKLESSNPLGSVKDRIGAAMINSAERDGRLQRQATIIEPTSGNTGIGLAFVCASRGYRLILTMPETMSRERRLLLAHLGAELILTPGADGMVGAIHRARELLAEVPGSWMPDQFANPANPLIHFQTTGPELWEQSGQQIDVLIAGVGTGGTITGAGRFLKQCRPDIRLVAVEPAESPVLSGGAPGKHQIQGIGAGFVPAVLDRELIDEIIQVPSAQALECGRLLAAREGILCGISSGAAVAAALELAKKSHYRGATLVVILPDTGERYLSTGLMQS